MFLGEHSHSIDQKGRVAVPSEFREAFRESLVVTRSFDGCIAVYPLSVWMQLAERLASLPLTRAANRRLNRAAFANAFSRELDSQGRIILPPPLREWARIEDEVMVVGMLNHFEIWSRPRWEEERGEIDDGMRQLAEDLDPTLLRP